MKTAKTLVISATVEAVSPISITQHGDRNKNKAPYAIVGGLKHACIPGSSVRGAIRRAARAEVERQLEKKKVGKWNLREFYWHTIGGVRLSKKDAGNDFMGISEVVPFTLVENIRARDPLMSLFGTFDPCAVTGRLQVGNAVCDTPILTSDQYDKQVLNLDIRNGIRADDLQRSPEIAQVLTPEALTEWADITSGARKVAALRREMEDLDKKARDAKRAGQDPNPFYEKIAKLEKERTALVEETKGSSVSIQQLIDAAEYIPAGSKMAQRIRVVNASDVEIGLLLAAMKMFARDNMIGGKRNIGNGETKTTWSIRDIDAGEVVAEVCASLDEGFVIISGKDYVSAMISAWDAFASSDNFKTHYPTKDEMKVAA